MLPPIKTSTSWTLRSVWDHWSAITLNTSVISASEGCLWARFDWVDWSCQKSITAWRNPRSVTEFSWLSFWPHPYSFMKLLNKPKLLDCTYSGTFGYFWNAWLWDKISIYRTFFLFLLNYASFCKNYVVSLFFQIPCTFLLFKSNWRIMNELKLH